MLKLWLNGQFLEPDAAELSVFDAGFQHAVGLFETMSAVNGRVFRAQQHIERLVGSARECMLSERLRVEPLVEAVNLVIEKNDVDEARVRLTVTGGNLNMLAEKGATAVDPTVLIVPQPPTPYPEEMFERGVTVAIANGGMNPFSPTAGHKTLNYWPNIIALNTANARGASEAIWLTSLGHVASGSVSNVFVVKDDALLTPLAHGETEAGAIPSPVLPGITRAAIIELAEQREVPVRRQMLTLDDLNAADEVFLTNSSWGVLPVVRIEQQKIRVGEVGELTRDLRRDWLDLRDRETSEVQAE